MAWCGVFHPSQHRPVATVVSQFALEKDSAGAAVRIPSALEHGNSTQISDPLEIPQPQPEVDIQKMEQIVEIMNKGGKRSFRFTCWDFGGQATFYGLHQLYMGRQGVYVIMFNMMWFVDGSGLQEFCPCGSRKRRSECRLKHIDYLRFWLDSIAAHAVDPKDHTVAPVILVGTHKDVVKDPADHEYISKMFYETFSRKSAWSNVHPFKKATVSSGDGRLWFFPVDNKTRPCKDPVMLEIQKVVQEVVKGERYVNEKVPFEWLKVLERLQANKESSITLDQVKQICEDVGMKSKEKDSLDGQVGDMLKRFHDLGQLMHHQEKSLQHLVILDPANFLVTPASRIICQLDMHEDEFHEGAKNFEGGRPYAKLRMGILFTKLLQFFWSDRPKDIPNLENLLVKFGFFVPILESTNDGMETCYLVPQQLPRVLAATERYDVTLKPKLVGYLFFAQEGPMKEIQKKGYVVIDEMKRDGFLPMGLGPAVIGQIVGACQCLHKMSLDDMKLTLTEVETAFGHHRFLLRTNSELQVMELIIMVDSSLLIAGKVLELVGKAVEKVMPTLKFALVVDQDGGRVMNGKVPTPKGPFVIIDDVQGGGLQDKLATDEECISVGPGAKLNPIQAQRQYQAWLRPVGLRKKKGYDIFISYRWTTEESGGMDTDLVLALNHMMCHELVGTLAKRQVHVFLDQRRLEEGRNFKIDFSEGAIHSTVMVLIMSKAAMQKMKNLKTDSEDNVLLEWTLALELVENSSLPRCLPVMIGDVSEDTGSITNLFADGIVDQLPEITCTCVIQQVEDLLRTNGHEPSPKLHTRTVRSTVKKLLESLGVPAWKIPLKWQKFVDTKPATGRILDNSGLAEALARKTEFTIQEWEAFGISDLRIGDVVISGDSYFTPATSSHGGGKGGDSISGINTHSQALWKQTIYSHIVKKAMKCVHTAEADGESKVTPDVDEIAPDRHAGIGDALLLSSVEPVEGKIRIKDEDARQFWSDHFDDAPAVAWHIFSETLERKFAIQTSELSLVKQGLTWVSAGIITQMEFNKFTVQDGLIGALEALRASNVAGDPILNAQTSEDAELEVMRLRIEELESRLRIEESKPASGAVLLPPPSTKQHTPYPSVDADEMEASLTLEDSSIGVCAQKMAGNSKLSPNVETEPERAPNIADSVEETETASEIMGSEGVSIGNRAQEMAEKKVEAEPERVRREQSISSRTEGEEERGFFSEDIPQPYETLSAAKVEECLQEAQREGGIELNTSKLNIVGEGRSGKTTWLDAISGKPFEKHDSTVGVNAKNLLEVREEPSLLEVNKVDIETNDGGGWAVVEDGSSLIPAEDEAKAYVAAQKALQETPTERRQREEAQRAVEAAAKKVFRCSKTCARVCACVHACLCVRQFYFTALTIFHPRYLFFALLSIPCTYLIARLQEEEARLQEEEEAKKRAEEVAASLRRQEAEAREKERADKEKLAFQKAELEKKLAKLVGWPSHQLQNYRVAVT